MSHSDNDPTITTHTKDSLSPEVKTGLFFAVIAYSLWGMMPLYLSLVKHVSSLEIVAHRIVWSVPFGAVLIGMRQQWPDVRAAFADRKVLQVLVLAAICISLNWLIYVWAVTQERILEASLGYFINPLMYVAAGVFILGEKLRPLQIIAVIIASLGVLSLTIGLGQFPWVSIILAALFTGYGYIRKTAPVGAMPGLFVETTLLTPFALGFLLLLAAGGELSMMNSNLQTDIFLLLAGPVTVLPLLFFALAAKRLTMVTIGIVQYIGPTLQFIFAIGLGEEFTRTHAVCFAMIWLALAIFTWDAFQHRPQKG